VAVPDNNHKPKLNSAEWDDIPKAKIGPINPLYDDVIPRALNATKDTIGFQIEDKTPEQLYAGIHHRISVYNLDPARTFDLLLAQRQGMTFIKRCAKGSLTQKQTK